MAEQFTLAEAVVSLSAQGATALAPVLGRVKAGVDAIGSAAGQMRDKVSSAFSSLMSPIGMIAGAAGVGLGTMALLKMAMTAEGAQRRFGSSFGAMAADAGDFADRLSSSLGRSRSEVQGFMTSFNGVLTTMGMSSRQSAAISENLVRQVYDIASAKGKESAEVADILRGVMLGEVEGLKRLGIAVNENVMKQQLLKMGFRGTWMEASEQQRAIAALAMVQEKLGSTQGAAGRNQDTLTGQWERFKGVTQDLGEMLGGFIGPAFQQILDVAASITQAITANRETFLAWGRAVAGAISYVTQPISIFFRILAKDGSTAMEYFWLQCNKVFDRIKDGFVILGRLAKAFAISLMEAIWAIAKNAPELVTRGIFGFSIAPVRDAIAEEMKQSFASNFSGLTAGLGQDSAATKAQEEAMTRAMQNAGFKDLADFLKQQSTMPEPPNVDLLKAFKEAKPGQTAADKKASETTTTAMDKLADFFQKREDERSAQAEQKRLAEAQLNEQKTLNDMAKGPGIKVQGLNLGWT